MSYADVLGHRDMAFDPVKNAGYMAALEAWVTPDTVVLDLGCGLASHGLYAARLGARHVYLVDPEVAVEVAREVANANGLGERVTALRGNIETIQLPEKVDLIISVFTGNILYSEDLLPSLYLARDRWLKPGGRLLPDCCELRVAAVQIPSLWQREIAAWDEPKHGLDYRALRRYASNAMLSVRDASDLSLLTEPAVMAGADFMTATHTDLDDRVSLTVIEAGECHGLLFWIRFRTGERWLETGPEARMHWTPQLLPIDPPIQLQPGQRIEAALHRKTWGDWTWSISVGSERRRHSSFLAQPLRARELAAASPESQAPLNEQGELALVLLQGFAGQRSNRDLAAEALERFPKRYPHGLEQAMQEVKAYALRYRGSRL